VQVAEESLQRRVVVVAVVAAAGFVPAPAIVTETTRHLAIADGEEDDVLVPCLSAVAGRSGAITATRLPGVASVTAAQELLQQLGQQ
jgi:hypothetical protein